MTREELRDYVEEQRSLNNIPYHVYSALIDGIDSLEQEPILDKIRAEIEDEVFDSLSDNGDDWFAASKVSECMDIIDKYINREGKE